MKKMREIRKPGLTQIIVWLVSLALAIGLFFFIRNFTKCWRITPLPGDVPQSCLVSENDPSTNLNQTPFPDSTAITNDTTSTTEPRNSGISVPGIEIPPAWDGVERISLLVIGLDLRDWEAGTGAPRSDTMMVVTLDPLNKIAGMLSIPRDMWVNIPEFGYNRINTAYSLGESWEVPGGGPGLAMRTVEDFIGVPITYFAQVDFHVFERVINEIGRIEVTPTQDVVLDRLGDGDIPVTLKAGETYSLGGDLALAYARARKTQDGDIDRANRQQEVVMAMLDRFLNPVVDIYSKFIPLYNELSSGVNMNLSLNDISQLLVYLYDNRDLEIQRGVIDFSMAAPITLETGEKILKPLPDQIRILRDQLFETGGALSPMAAGDLNALITSENASVSVFSSIAVEGIASRTADFFKNEGLNTFSAGNSSEGSLKTIVIDHTGNPYTLKFLMEMMNLDNSQILVRIDFNAASDVEIHIGNDWASNNSMP
ncbi:LCP family protein [Chloroflexota bacterium]